MRRRVAWQRVGVAAVFLAAAGVAGAAVQGRDRVYWLGTGDWQLCEKDGGVSLVECRWDRSDRLPKNDAGRWHVSVPTIRAESGKYLAWDATGREPSVTLVDDRGANTRWVLEFVSVLRPGGAKGEHGLKEGPSGFTFRVKAAEGPFQDWYLAGEESGPEPEKRQGAPPASRSLKLVRDVKKATVFTYIEENYYVDHK